MQVSAAVVERLVANGIDTVFGIPGKQSLPLNERIDDREDVRFVVARHETAVSHQAWGYAETSGRMAATVVVPGPGDMNAMNGLKNALNDCTPLLHVAIETERELRGGDAIHETPVDTYDNVVKENVLVETPESTAAELERAIAVARTPPKGPVRVGIPKDFLGSDAAVADCGSYPTPGVAPPSSETIAEIAALLDGASTPLVVAGGGVRTAGATDELVATAERLQAPVVTTYKGKGVFPEDHPLSAGTICGSTSPELYECIAESDVALAVGSDLDAVSTAGWTVDLPDRLIHVTLDADDVGTGYGPTVGVVGDARAVLAMLNERLAPRRSPSTAGADRVERVNRRYADRIEALLAGDRRPMTSVRALGAIRDALPREAVTTVDAGGFRVWALNVFDAYGPRRYANPGSWATMGTGLPSAIGAQLSNPDVPVVAITGDGGLLMCVHELHTAVAEEIPVTVVVLNNSDYAIISEEADRAYDMDAGVYGWQADAVDFATVAEGMGMRATSVDDPDDLHASVREAVRRDDPALVEVRTDPDEPQASAYMSG